MELDPRSLDTIGEEHYGGVVTTTFSAHPKVDHMTGELVNIGNMVHGPGGPAEIRYDIIDATGKPRKTEIIPMPHMSLMHTFLVTENHVVFPVTPLDQDLERAKRGGPMLAWVPDRPTKLGVMPREGTAADVRWFEMEPRHMFHELNMWEDGDTIVADVATAASTALFPDVHGRHPSHAETVQSLRRWTIDLAGNTDTVREEVLNDHDIQFPRPDDRRVTHGSRYAYTNSNLHSVDGRVDGMDAVLRIDTLTGAEDLYHFGDGVATGELVFAPRVGGTEESDGYAITLVHRAGAGESELVVFDARDLAGGPPARVHIPFRVPSGFHCNYYSADSALYRETLG